MSLATRENLQNSIAQRIADYRRGEIAPRTPDDIDRWVRQFDLSVQDAMLAEMDYVLRQSYLSREHFLNFIRKVANSNNLLGGSGFRELLRGFFGWLAHFGARRTPQRKRYPKHWENICLLQIQRHGNSQREMVCLLQEVLSEKHGFSIASCGPATGPFLYLDDVLFTGNRIILDLVQWIQKDAPPRADLLIILIAIYRRGFWYTRNRIRQAATDAGKVIRVHWLWSVEFENRQSAGVHDGFYPASLPDHPLAHAYARQLGEAGSYPRFRAPAALRQSRLFSSEAGRHLLEQQFLIAGLRIRSFYRNPQEVMRPLGYHTLNGLGFGSSVVTYRNCPNNCPLAWWWDTAALSAASEQGSWYPLFPRKV